jgi:hypothetical protein
MLLTTVDGLWALQVLSGIEDLSAELGLRPHLPSAETPETARRHPVYADLLAAGAIGSAGDVDPPIREWLTVLSRRDVALVVAAQQSPSEAGAIRRALIARFDRWWVVLERSQELVRLGPVGVATSEHGAAELIAGELARLCPDRDAADLKPVTLAREQMLSAVRDGAGMETLLRSEGLDADQIRTLIIAADTAKTTQISIVAVQAEWTRLHVGAGAVTIIDTPRGRLFCEHASRAGRDWMIVAPGSLPGVSRAVVRMLRRLPANSGWHSHRRVV